MVSTASKKIDREGLLDAIRAAAKAEKGKVLTLRKFVAISKMGSQHVFRHFSKWNHALRAAGFEFERFNTPVTSAHLLEDWARVARKHGRIPTHFEYNLHSRHSTSTFVKRFGAWSRVPEAFRAFARNSRNSRQWSDVLALLPPCPGVASQSRTCPGVAAQTAPSLHSRPLPSAPCPPKPWRRRINQRRRGRFPGRHVYGPPIDFEGLRNAPVNEAGVVFIFGGMATRLGFMVESLQAGFPDCEAKRLVGPGEWQTVRIEFEYESRNFHEHCHDPEGCDVIVCWNHNWTECPEHIEVIALSEHIARLAVEGVPARQGGISDT